MTIAEWYMTFTAEISKTLEIYNPANGIHEDTNCRKDLCGSIFGVLFGHTYYFHAYIRSLFFNKNVYVKN